MKNSSFLALFAVSGFLGSVSVSAASISIGNVQGIATDLNIRSSTGGTTFTSGVLAFYRVDTVPTTAAAALALGASNRVGAERVLGASDFLANGAFDITNYDLGSFTRLQAESDTRPFIVVIGDGSSVANSMELAVLQITSPPQAATEQDQALYSYTLSSADVSVGTPGTGTVDYSAIGGAAFSSFGVETLNLAQAVPEPSTAALLGLGALGLIRRRR